MKRIHLHIAAVMLFSALVCLPAMPVRAGGWGGEDLVKKYFEADGDDARAAVLKEGDKFEIPLANIAAALPERKKFSAPETEENEFTHEFNEKDRAVFHVPDSYDGTKPYGLIVHLFGAGGFGKVGAMRWAETVGDKDYLVLTPYRFMGMYGNRETGESRYWEEDVAEFVMQCIEYALDEFNVDPDRVYVSGFSNGAHGVWSIASYWPDRLSAVTAHCGSPAIHYVYGYPMYICNMRHLGFDLRMGGQDRQDWRTVQHCASVLDELGADSNFFLEESRGHRWMSDKAPEILKYFGKTRRVLYPEEVSLRIRNTDFGKSYWLRIDEIGDCEKNAVFSKDWSRAVLKIRGTGSGGGVKMGFNHNPQHGGEGVQVGQVIAGTPAANCGLQAGDIIRKVGEHEVKTIQDLRNALSKFKLKDKSKVTVERDGEEVELEITFTPLPRQQRPGQPQPKPFPVDSARIESKLDRENNTVSLLVAKVKKFTVFLHKDMGLDLSQPVKIKVNGKEVFAGAVKENVETLLEHARVYHDSKRVFTATVSIDVAAGTGKAITGIGKVVPSKIESEPDKEETKKEPAKEKEKEKEEEKPAEKPEPKEKEKDDDGWR
ncbi:MAG: PDZ domain-containing protein [Planctomycetota bacterium]